MTDLLNREIWMIWLTMHRILPALKLLASLVKPDNTLLSDMLSRYQCRREWWKGDDCLSPVDRSKAQDRCPVVLATTDDPDVLRLSALCLFSFIQDKKSIDAVHSRDRLPPWKYTSDRRVRRTIMLNGNGKRAGTARDGPPRPSLLNVAGWVVQFLFREKSTLSSSRWTTSIVRCDGRTRCIHARCCSEIPPSFFSEIQWWTRESDPIDVSRAISSIYNENRIARLHCTADICGEEFRQTKVRQWLIDSDRK